MKDERENPSPSLEDSSDRTESVDEPVSDEASGETSPRVVDAGTDDELVILDLSTQLAEDAAMWMPQGAAEPEPEPAPPPPPRPAALAPEPEPEPPAPTPEEERRARINEVVGRDWERELTHVDKPAAKPPPSRSRRSARTPSGTVIPLPPRGTSAVTAASAAVFVAATALMALRIEPFATWYYLFAWYPFLLLVNHATAARSPRHSVLGGRAMRIAALAAWSIPVWMVFEAWNLRLADWMYAGVPDRLPLRWTGVALSFATVLPGIFFLEEMLRVRSLATKTATPPFPVSGRVERILLWTGVACGVLTLAAPRFFYPLVWGVPVLLLEPWLHRRDASSLLRQLAGGRPGLLIRLLLAGAFCGLFWEAANYFALGKWIYTIPGFTEGKLFEMPFLGFVGFPPFALCCWTMARALVVTGLLGEWDVDAGARDEDAALAARPRTMIRAGAVAFTLLMLLAMDRWTVSSTTPRPADVPGIPDGVAEYAAAHHKDSIRGLLELIDEGRLYVPGESSEEAVALLKQRCRLVQLDGIGTANARRLDAAGVRTIDELAAADPAELTDALRDAEPGWRPHPRRVLAWVSAARRARPGVPTR